LTNRVGRVVAVDIYGEGSFSGGEADARMLTDPDAFAPYPYLAERLEVRRMDGRKLEFQDETFDVVCSLSSIEHFGSSSDIASSAREIGRVLKPGGYAFIVTECFTARHPLNSKLLQSFVRLATFGRRCKRATPWRRAVDVFTPRELHALLVAPSGLRLLQELDLTVSPANYENVIQWLGEGRFESSGRTYPHIMLQPQGSIFFFRGGAAPFTSVALAMIKPAK
jgi:SAM-dependent methyltransferase